MATAIFITQKDLKEFTSANGNIDPDKLEPFIKVAQDLEIERILGTKLTNKINDDIVNDTLADPYLSLVRTYVKPTLCWYALYHASLFHAYQFNNMGLFKHQSESSITPEKSEIDFFRKDCEYKAQHYADRMIKYLCDFSSNFPEYSQLEKGGVWADRQTQSFGGINLDDIDYKDGKVITLQGKSRKY